MVPGLADGSKHGCIGRGAVLQQGDLVSQDQRTADDRLFQGDLLFQDVDVAGLAFQFRENRRALLRRKGTAGVFEPHRLSGMPPDQDIGVRQTRTGRRAEQTERRHRSSLEYANGHGRLAQAIAPHLGRPEQSGRRRCSGRRKCPCRRASSARGSGRRSRGGNDHHRAATGLAAITSGSGIPRTPGGAGGAGVTGRAG